MHHATIFVAALGVAVAAAAPSQAAHHKIKTAYHLVRKEKSAPVRVCDWVGPGGRAVYRCTTVQPQQQSFLDLSNDPAPPICDWIGPGGRAVYRCQ